MGPITDVDAMERRPRIEHRFPGRLALVVITICQACRIKQLIEAKRIKYSKSRLFS
jgi:hypothetical protein